jgi:hypothetical protein
MSGSFECLKYAHENGAPWNMAADVCKMAVIRSLECLSCLHEYGCQWDEAVCKEAVRGDRWECLRLSAILLPARIYQFLLFFYLFYLFYFILFYFILFYFEGDKMETKYYHANWAASFFLEV